MISFGFISILLSVFVHPVLATAAPSTPLLHCNSRSPWTLKNKDGVYLAVQKQDSFFTIDPRQQTQLICGDPLRHPRAEIQIFPSIQVLKINERSVEESAKAADPIRPGFEKDKSGGFKFWLSGKKNRRECEIVCQPHAK